MQLNKGLLFYVIAGFTIGGVAPVLLNLLGITVFLSTEDIMIRTISGIIGIFVGLIAWKMRTYIIDQAIGR